MNSDRRVAGGVYPADGLGVYMVYGILKILSMLQSRFKSMECGLM